MTARLKLSFAWLQRLMIPIILGALGFYGAPMLHFLCLWIGLLLFFRMIPSAGLGGLPVSDSCFTTQIIYPLVFALVAFFGALITPKYRWTGAAAVTVGIAAWFQSIYANPPLHQEMDFEFTNCIADHSPEFKIILIWTFLSMTAICIWQYAAEHGGKQANLE